MLKIVLEIIFKKKGHRIFSVALLKFTFLLFIFPKFGINQISNVPNEGKKKKARVPFQRVSRLGAFKKSAGRFKMPESQLKCPTPYSDDGLCSHLIPMMAFDHILFP